jgi:hypothetical protein
MVTSTGWFYWAMLSATAVAIGLACFIFCFLRHPHEIKSTHILSPGPVAIQEGLPQLAQIIERWAMSAA